MYKKKIKKLLIGTNNKGKLREIRALLPKNIKTYSPSDFGIKSPKESGKSFKENALIKSKYFSKKTNLACLSDDSGLEIDKLNKAPGIYSARWAGKKMDFNLAIKKVFRRLKDKDKKWKSKKNKCRFICALSIYWPNGKSIHKTGKVEGTLSESIRGKNGFGYDPIFIPEGKNITFGEMKPIQKYKIDHRIKAFRKIKKFL